MFMGHGSIFPVQRWGWYCMIMKVLGWPASCFANIYANFSPKRGFQSVQKTLTSMNYFLFAKNRETTH